MMNLKFMVKRIFVSTVLCIIITILLFTSTAFAGTLTEEQRNTDAYIFSYIDEKKPMSQYQIKHYSGSSDLGGICNVAAMTTLLNRRLAAENKTETFTAKQVFQSLGCTNISSDGKLYGNKGFENQRYYYSGSTGHWWNSDVVYKNGYSSYQVRKITGETIRKATNKDDFNAYMAGILHEHPEGVAVRILYGSTGGHVIVFYKYEYVNGKYVLYVKDPVGNYSGKYSGSWMATKCSESNLYSNIQNVVYIKGGLPVIGGRLLYYESAKRSINEGSLADGTWSYEKPSYESKTVKYWKNGEIIDTIAIYEDTEGRLWCELADHTFIEKDMEFDGTEWERCAFVESTATYWATGIKYSTTEGVPSGKLLPHGELQNFPLIGTVYSSDSITDVIGYIYRTDGSIAMQSDPMNLTGTATSVDIRNSNVNNNLSFRKLENGVYRYEVVVYTRHGEGIKVIESVFGVGVEPNIPLTGLTFENGNKTISLNAATAETFTLVPKYSPSNTAETGVTWSSSDPSVATVSEGGAVKAVAPGTATITAVSKVHSEISVSCEVTVYSHITSFTLDRERVDISTADGVSSFDLTANVQPAGTACDFEWRTSNSAVATVSGTNGNVCTVLLTGNTGGAVITAKALDGSGLEKTCVINVADPSASSLKITNFAYPVTYKISSTGFNWSYSGSGSFSSNYDLTELQINIYYGTAGTKISYSHPIPAGTKSITMNTKDSKGNTVGHYVAMSKVDKAGYGKIEVIVSDASGARISRSATFNAVTSGTTATSSFSTTYTTPTLVAEKELNGHKYQLYKSSYTWNQVNDYANSLGGHLATISDENENQAINSLIQGISSTAAWLGGYHDSNGWHWVTGEPFAYTHWASDAPSYTCGQEDKLCIWNSNSNWNDEMPNYKHDYFVVEYESPIESIKFERPWANLTLDRDYYGHPTYIEFTLRDGVDPETFQPPKMIYQSSDTSVVTVDQDGVLMPVCAAGSAVVYAWPENYPGMVAQLEVGCYTVTNVEMGIEGYGQNVYSAVMNTGTEFTTTWFYEYEGTIYGEDYVEFGYIGDGGNDEYPVVVCDNEYSNYYKAVGSGTGYAYYYAFDQNGEMITADQITVYVYGAGDEMKLPANCKTVESEAFMNTGARYLVIPAGVEEIKEDAFSNCNFDTVIFKGGNTRIEEGAFSGYPTFMFLRPGGKAENALREHGMYCLDAVYVEGSN